jgi:xanthine dehydrogenase YagS FAD-binding subunit
MLPKFTYVRPTTVNEALTVLNDRPSLIHGGGTDLLGCLREGVFSADTMVSLSSIDELKGIRRAKDGGLRIGALTTVAEVAASTSIAPEHSALQPLPEATLLVLPRPLQLPPQGRRQVLCLRG